MYGKKVPVIRAVVARGIRNNDNNSGNQDTVLNVACHPTQNRTVSKCVVPFNKGHQDTSRDIFHPNFSYETDLNKWFINNFHQGSLSIQESISMVDRVRAYDKPNIYAARIPVPSRWNFPLLWQLSTSTSDKETFQFLLYGWSLNHDDSATSMTMANHRSAIAYPLQMDKFHSQRTIPRFFIGPIYFITLDV